MYASEFSSLKFFKTWIEKSFPIPHLPIRVELTECETVVVPGNKCPDCNRKWQVAKLLEAVSIVNWKKVASVDLSVLVSIGNHMDSSVVWE